MRMTDASTDALIDGLADDLQPVRPRRLARGGLWVAAAWITVGTLLLWLLGMRHDLAAGVMMAPLPMLSLWLIAALGLSAAWSALRMGLPGVGHDYSGWRWAGLASLALPITALFMGVGDSHGAMEAMHPQTGLRCTLDGLVGGLGVGIALFFWLKGSAPTSPARAGWVVGIAAGAAGATILALHCSSDDMVHIAFWHGLVVVCSGVAGRLALAPLLRW